MHLLKLLLNFLIHVHVLAGYHDHSKIVNIYGIKSFVGTKSRLEVHVVENFKHHQFTLKFPRLSTSHKKEKQNCFKQQIVKTITYKRIGGNYVYGPRFNTSLQNSVCTLPKINAVSKNNYMAGKVRYSKKPRSPKTKAWCRMCSSYWSNIRTKSTNYKCCKTILLQFQ